MSEPYLPDPLQKITDMDLHARRLGWVLIVGGTIGMFCSLWSLYCDRVRRRAETQTAAFMSRLQMEDWAGLTRELAISDRQIQSLKDARLKGGSIKRFQVDKIGGYPWGGPWIGWGRVWRQGKERNFTIQAMHGERFRFLMYSDQP